MPLELCNCWEASQDRAFSGERVLMEFEFTDPAGRRRFIWDIFVPEFAADGSVQTVLAISQDVTELVEAWEALRKSEQRLAADLDAMIRLQKLGTLFLREGNLEQVLAEIVGAAIAISGADFGNIQLLDPKTHDLKIVYYRGFPPWWVNFWKTVSASHDLQEPLRAAEGLIGRLRDRCEDKLDDRAKQYVRFAVQGAQRMSQLVYSLLEYSRVQNYGLQSAPTHMKDVFDQAVANYAAGIAESGAVVTCDDLPTIMGDATQLEQLLQNLIGNAVKFRRNGVRPEIHVGAEKVSGFRGQGTKVRRQASGDGRQEAGNWKRPVQRIWLR